MLHTQFDFLFFIYTGINKLCLNNCCHDDFFMKWRNQKLIWILKSGQFYLNRIISFNFVVAMYF